MARPYEYHYLTEERKKVAEDNIPFMWYYFKKKVSPRLKEIGDNEREEISSALFFGLCQAAEKWDPERGKFSTCAGWYFKSAVNLYFNNKEKFYERYTTIPFINLEGFSNDVIGDYEDYGMITKGGVLKKYDGIEERRINWETMEDLFKKAELTNNEEEILLYRYKFNFNPLEIGQMMGLTRERIRQLLKDIIDKIQEYVNMMGLSIRDYITV